MLKKLVLLIVAFIVIASANTTLAQTVVPNYGITTSGVIFIREDVVDKLCQAGNEIFVAGNWQGWQNWTPMKLVDYNGVGLYILETNKTFKANGKKVLLVFQLTSEIYYPQAAIDNNDPSLNMADVVPNSKNDGNNLEVYPINYQFRE